MKKVIVLGIVLTMVMVFAAGANAWIIKVGTQNSGQGQISDAGNSTLSLGPVVGPEARYGLYVGNAVTAADPTLLTLKMNPAPQAWYGKVWAVNGYDGKASLKFFAAGATTVAPGTWYLYQGIGEVRGDKVWGAEKVAEGSFLGTVKDYPSATFGYDFALGSQFTLSQLAPGVVPEPGSIVALFSGLAGLAGFGIRRRK